MTTYTISIVVDGKDNASPALNKVGGALGNMGQIAGGIIGAGIFTKLADEVVEFGKKAVGATADFQAMQVGLESLLAREIVNAKTATESWKDAGATFTGGMSDALAIAQKSSGALMESLAQIAILSPYESSTVTQTYRMGMAFGYTSKESEKFTKAMLNVAAGVGADNGMLDRMAYNFAQIRLQGKVTAMDVRQLALAGFDLTGVLKYVGKQIGVNIKDHNDFNAALESGKITWAEFNDLFAQYADENFGGASERMSRTLKGLRSTLNDVLVLSMPKILGPSAEIFTKFANKILNKFLDLRNSGKLDEWGTALATGTDKFITGLETLPGRIQSTITSVQNLSFGDILKGTDTWTNNIWDWIDTAKSLSLGKLNEFLGKIAEDVALTDWSRTDAATQTWVNNIWSWIDVAAGETGPRMQTFLDSIGTWANDPNTAAGIQAIGKKIGFEIAWLGVGDTETSVKIGSSVIAFITEVGNKFTASNNIISEIGSNFSKGLLDGILAGIAKEFNIGPEIKEKLQNALSESVDTIFNPKEGAKNIFSGLADRLKEELQKAFSGFFIPGLPGGFIPFDSIGDTGGGGKPLQSLTQSVAEGLGETKTEFTGFSDWMSSYFFGSVMTGIEEKWRMNWKTLSLILSGEWPAMQARLSEMSASMTGTFDTIRGSIDSAAAALRNFMDLKAGAASIGSGTGNSGNSEASTGGYGVQAYKTLEARASGGPVFPGRDYLIGEKRPEVVRFPSNGWVFPSVQNYATETGASGGGGSTINYFYITPTNDIDIEELTHKITKVLRSNQ